MGNRHWLGLTTCSYFTGGSTGFLAEAWQAVLAVKGSRPPHRTRP